MVAVTLRSGYVAFLFCLDSGYLFSGSRPPSRVSPPGEVSLSGKEKESWQKGLENFAGTPEAG